MEIKNNTIVGTEENLLLVVGETETSYFGFFYEKEKNLEGPGSIEKTDDLEVLYESETLIDSMVKFGELIGDCAT